MPRVLVAPDATLPLEYVTPGEEYDVSIGERDVHYSRPAPDGKGRIGTYGRRWDYAKYIRDGRMKLISEGGEK